MEMEISTAGTFMTSRRYSFPMFLRISSHSQVSLLRPWRSVDDDLPTSPLKFHVRRLGREISFQANDAIGRGVNDVVPTFGRHRPLGNYTAAEAVNSILF